MRKLTRLEEPRVLANKKAEWTRRYVEKRTAAPGTRPDSKQYAHRDIRNTLMAISHQKCFYCEAQLADVEAEVDHHIEVASRPDLAFVWENLNLACRDCNQKKLPDSTIPVTECIDPCSPDARPELHLRFDEGYVMAAPGSTVGLKTIQKYRLDRESLNHKRIRQLMRVSNKVKELLHSMKEEGRREATPEEKQQVLRFAQPDQAYSLMMCQYVDCEMPRLSTS